MQDNGTGIHWHGMRQLHSVGMDGVPGITECRPKGRVLVIYPLTSLRPFGTRPNQDLYLQAHPIWHYMVPQPLFSAVWYGDTRRFDYQRAYHGQL